MSNAIPVPPTAAPPPAPGPKPDRLEPANRVFYELVQQRRDVRVGFTGEPISPVVLARVLAAAHCAPSVGLSQPWDFVIIDDHEARDQFRVHVHEHRKKFADGLSEERQAVFDPIRIEGIAEATLGVVVTYDPTRAGPAVLGRASIDDTGVYSVCLAIQNLWLAATAEQLGVGWVSFYHEPFLQTLCGLPDHIRPVAWLCVGPVSHLPDSPDLERLKWRDRRPLAAALHHNTWGTAPPATSVAPLPAAGRW